MLFSERNGIIPAKKIQIESMDEDLTNRLWNAIHWIMSVPNYNMMALWTDFFKRLRDEMTDLYFEDELEHIKMRYFKMSWNQIFDLIEFICKRNYELQLEDSSIQKFIHECNRILEEEVSGYRIIDSNVMPITSHTELTEIEHALQTPMTNVNNHLKLALEKLSDRSNPEYSDSIKESISAVEATCRKIVGNESLTLGRALTAMKKMKQLNLHPSMINAFSNMYGYTSGDSGIRHAMHDSGRHITFADAKFFLVACSAFINYLISIRSNRSG